MSINDFANVLAQYGLKIHDPLIYEEAFTHRSYLNESKEVIFSNERLEFLGDSVLSFIISSYLFKNRPQDKEGDLTNLRSYIVKTDSLAKAAAKIKLGQFLQLSKGEELSGGRENLQLLANTYEAVLGAIFLDLGIDKARDFVYETLLPLFAQEVKIGAPRDPKSRLQEIAQSKFKTSPKYKVLETMGPDHAKHFTVGVSLQDKQVGIGGGTSKQQAEEAAAEQALSTLTDSLP